VKIHTDHTTAAQEQLDVRDETAQRLSRLTSVERTRALVWLAMKQPDVLNEALDETEAQR
jgi:hypothetical protein